MGGSIFKKMTVFILLRYAYIKPCFCVVDSSSCMSMSWTWSMHFYSYIALIILQDCLDNYCVVAIDISGKVEF